MTLTDYSLDDLHLLATAELDDTAVELLNDLYRTMTDEYIAWLRALRERERAAAGKKAYDDDRYSTDPLPQRDCI